ncbi:MAG: hypothetical protein JSV80_03335, partial [Acidobacteriota bacterium]
MKRKLIVVIATIALLTGVAHAAGQWLHIRVESGGEDAELVKVNLPLDLMLHVAPAVGKQALKEALTEVTTELESEGIDLQSAWSALRDSEDGEYVTVQGKGESVYVFKRGGFLMVDVEGGEDEPEKVKVRVPLDVIDAL